MDQLVIPAKRNKTLYHDATQLNLKYLLLFCLDEMLDDMQKLEFRDHIRAVTSTDYGVDLQKRKGMEQEPAASFRKLNVE